MNLLILNGDSTSNRGDRAILLGNITLLRHIFPEATIKAFSYLVERDEKWYGIHFYQRASLLEKVKAFWVADAIFWGGGELIQDDTSKVKIPYWFVVIIFLTVVCRKKVIGLGQGLGPVSSPLNKFLSKIMLNRLTLFLSRDDYSGDMIRAMGSSVKVIESHDPAILVSDVVQTNKNDLITYLQNNGMSVDSRSKIVGVGVRRWFHQQSSWIPHKYAVKYKLRKIPGDAEFLEMKTNLASILDHLIAEHGYKVVFFPMYTPSHEADDKVSRQVIEMMQHKADACVFKDDISPQAYLKMIAGADLFFGIRLHSTILSTCIGIPSLTFYYVPKGKSYFKQIGIPENSFPVESLLSAMETKSTLKQFDYVIENESEYRDRITSSVSVMKSNLLKDAQILKTII